MPDPSISPRKQLLATLDEQPIYSIYRLYDGPRLLYVGITCNVKSRIVNHLRTKAWANYVTRIDVDGGYTKAGALEKEAGQIHQHIPTHNQTHNIPSKRRTAARAKKIEDDKRAMDAGLQEKLGRLPASSAVARGIRRVNERGY